jgi:four helix bundle protein
MQGERKAIKRHTELEVYKRAFAVAMRVFEVTKSFPQDERYAMIDQMRRSSRSVCANLAEAWRKRRYEAAFISKLSDSEAEAAETQTWILFAVECGYLSRETAATLYTDYEVILDMLIQMITHPQDWTL